MSAKKSGTKKTSAKKKKSSGTGDTGSRARSASQSQKPAAQKEREQKTFDERMAEREERMERIIRRRTLRAWLYLFLAFVGALSYMNVNGFLIDWYKYFVASVIGFGYYPAILAFLLAGILLLAKRGGNTRIRELSIMLLPVIFGVVGHIVRDETVYPVGREGLRLLSAAGRELTSGGLVSGSVGIFLRSALSSTGGLLLCAAAALLCAFAAAAVSPIELIKRMSFTFDDEDNLNEDGKPAKTSYFEQIRKATREGREMEQELTTSEEEIISIAPEPEPEPIRVKQPKRRAEPAPEPVRRPEPVPRPEPRRERSKPVFVDFFPEDNPPAPPKPNPVPPHKDPTRPVTPDFSVDTADNLGMTIEEDPSVTNNDFLAPWETAVSKGKGSPSVTVRGDRPFEIFTEDNPPPAELSLDEKREASAEAHARAAEENDVSDLMKRAEKAPEGKYIYPPLTLLPQGDPSMGADHDSIVRYAERLVDTLKSFNIESTIVNVTKGPTVTRYELQLQRGTKISKVVGLSEDIALALGAAAVRISPIPANNSVGIEVPNEVQEVVGLRDILESKSFTSAKSCLTFAVGKDIAGQCVVGDIAKMPHMLIAGTTGSGKSVCVNSMIISLLYKSSPEEVRFIMVDPKMIELGDYNGIPHMLIPVVTDPKKAVGALNWAVGEMMRRYKLLSDIKAKDLESYNEEIRRRGEGEALPRIVIVIDELADMMFVAAREVEESIARIAQMARAAGMHLIIATQRPSADVITGLMKANIPSRIAFAVASQIDSRIILDQNGAEKLIGRGDMLYNPLGAGKPMRVQGCFISGKEVETVLDFVKKTGQAAYSQDIMDQIERQAEASAQGAGAPAADEGDEDPMLMDAIAVVVDRGEASTSLLQRRLKLGYARAARLIDIMEERGIVGPFEGSKPRSVSITPEQWAEMRLRMTE